MAEKNPIDDLFDEINSILRFLDRNLEKTPSGEEIPPDVIQKLITMERRVDLLNRISDDIVAAAGLSKEEMHMRLQGLSRDLPEDDRKTISKGEALKSTAEAFKKKVEERERRLSAEPEGEREQPAKGGARGDAVDENDPLSREAADLEALLDKPQAQESKPVEGRKRKNKFKRFGGDDKWKPL